MISFAPFLLSGSPRVALKVLVWLAAPGQVTLDRAINLALIALSAASVYRVTRLARSGMLWRVSRKLILSYILVGAVPILLLVTFSLLAFLLRLLRRQLLPRAEPRLRLDGPGEHVRQDDAV